ncbi:MAG TPA: branched-chain amino acid ABC transporter ATP-binding protein/permease [Streptosporangiaceae bacterium]|nr:branched-chain amino acid ABC transporter ATP-binding protein/permease [Streptosporangiaceae bacterium]
MNNSVLFYLTTLLVYGGVDAMACLGLSQQFGIAGVTNFGFIIFQAAGAYTAAVLALPPDTANGHFQTYLGGLQLPFPLPWLGAALVGALLALPFTFLVGRRLRGDFAAIGLLVAAVMANLLATDYRPALNGDAGLSLIPSPLGGEFDPQSAGYQWLYAGATVALAAGVYWFVRRITESPYGRSLRAMRDNDLVAEAVGKNLVVLRMGVLVLGGAIAGLSGGVLVGFINLWAPSAWTYAETVVLLAAVIIGGAGNHRGAVFGALLVPLGFEEATRFLPAFGPPGLVPALQWVAIGLLIVVFLWFRPQGVFPERRHLIAAGLPGGAPPLVATPPPAAQSGAVLEAVDIVRNFAGAPAVAGVSFALPRGRLTGLIGPNGAGKSTLLAVLAGTLPASSGTIRYRGQDVTAMPSFRRARAGLIRTFQLASEFKRLTVLENLLTAVPDQRGDSLRGAVRGAGYWRQDEADAITRAMAMLDRFGLREDADTCAGDLSGGQRRTVEIMRALMARPSVLLLDEPMAGLHPDLARRLGAELSALCREGMTILMVEHELALVEEICDLVIVMAEGVVLAEGTMAGLRSQADVVEAYLG